MLRIFLLLLFLKGSITYAQENYRIRAGFSIKEKNTLTNQSKLTIGTVYYDVNVNILHYDITFPVKEKLIVTDTIIYRIQNDSLFDKSISFNVNKFSVFNLSLSNNLNSYGLETTGYTLSNVERDAGMIISTWSPPAKVKDIKGDILLSRKNEKLYGIVSLDSEGNVIGKQIFTEYFYEKGFEFPTKVTQIMESGETKVIKESTYKNIVVNEADNTNYTIDISKY